PSGIRAEPGPALEAEDAASAEALSGDHHEQGRAEEEVGEVREEDPAERQAEKRESGLVHEAETREEVEEDVGVAGDDPYDDQHPGEVPGPRPQQDGEEGGDGGGRQPRHQ